MTNTLKLKGLIVSNGLTIKETAKLMKISYFTLSKKINNIVEFKSSEIDKLCKILSITDKDEIFFTNL